MKILAVGGWHYGFRFYGPFTDEEVDDDPAALEERHQTEKDFHEGYVFWAEMLTPEGK